MNKKWVLLLLLILFVAAYAYTFTGTNRITSTQAKEMLESGLIDEVVDVRTRAEYGAGHYPGALNIPVTEIDAQTTSGLSTTGGILVYCNTGQRARFAAEKLNAMGFKNVYYIAGPYGTLA
jgi:phage shock protein E